MRILTICAFALAVMTPGFSQAASDGATSNSVAVWTRDLNPSRPHDAKVLLQRIDDAAMEACGAALWSNPMERREVQTSECYQHIMTQAVAEVNNRAITKLYASAGSAPGRR